LFKFFHPIRAMFYSLEWATSILISSASNTYCLGKHCCSPL
jgi:hypothetical protein